jgi:Helix-turn-helix.
MNNISSRLPGIFAQFGLTSRDVADMLNIHYSLVSKWLNNKRPLRYNSQYMKKLTDVLISLDAQGCSGTLKAILLEAYPDADLNSKEKLAVYLSHYLATDNLGLEKKGFWGILKQGISIRGPMWTSIRKIPGAATR